MTHRDEDEEIIGGALNTLAWQRKRINELKESLLRATREIQGLKDALAQATAALAGGANDAED